MILILILLIGFIVFTVLIFTTRFIRLAGITTRGIIHPIIRGDITTTTAPGVPVGTVHISQ